MGQVKTFFFYGSQPFQENKGSRGDEEKKRERRVKKDGQSFENLGKVKGPYMVPLTKWYQMILSWNYLLPPKDFKLQIYWFWEKIWTKTLPGKIQRPFQVLCLLHLSPLNILNSWSTLLKLLKVPLFLSSDITQEKDQSHPTWWFRLRRAQIFKSCQV